MASDILIIHSRPYLLSFLHSRKVNLCYVILKSGHEQCVIVSQKQTVHVSSLLHSKLHSRCQNLRLQQQYFL